MGKLSKSEEFYRKKCLLDHELVPIQTEIRTRLGDSLTSVLFDTCMPELKRFLGLVPELNGAGDELWCSPSDLLLGKVRLKPPLTNTVTKALTHQGILEIGRVIEKKWEYEHELDIKRAVAECEEVLRFQAEKEKAEAVEKAKQLKEEECKQKIVELNLKFEETLQNELEALEEKLLIEKENAVEMERNAVLLMMQEKMEIAIAETVEKLTAQFANELLLQSQKLHKHFWYHIKEEKRRSREALKSEQLKCKENLTHLRYEMQCENIANIMYVLANERRRCKCAQLAMESNYRAQLTQFEKELDELKQREEKLKDENKTRDEQIKCREQALYEIIKQFQKFINFILRAAPMQAEYLLNVEKLMIFELTKAVMDLRPEEFAKLKETIEAGSDIPSTTDSCNCVKCHAALKRLVAPDAHDCYNRARVVKSVHTLKSDEDLPAFVFNENLYVREDFRNMISQGLRLCRSNEFWSFDVEDLTEKIDPDLETKTNISDTCNYSVKSLKSFTKLRGIHLDDKSDMANKQSEKEIKSLAYDNNIASSAQFEPRLSRIEDHVDSLLLVTKRSVGKRLEQLKEEPTIKFDTDVDVDVDVDDDDIGSIKKDFAAASKESKLISTVDSLELLKVKSSNWGPKGIADSSAELLSNTCFPRKMRCIGVQCGSQHKRQYSSGAIIPKENLLKASTVSFHPMSQTIHDAKRSKRNEKRDSIKKKPSKELAESTSDLVITRGGSSDDTRINKLLSIFRQDTSLRALFMHAHKN